MGNVLGVISLVVGAVPFLIGSEAPNRSFTGYWVETDIPISRIGNAAWSVAFASWGIVALGSNANRGGPIVFATFALVVAAGVYDSWLVRRAQRISKAWRPRRKQKPESSSPPHG